MGDPIALLTPFPFLHQSVFAVDVGYHAALQGNISHSILIGSIHWLTFGSFDKANQTQ